MHYFVFSNGRHVFSYLHEPFFKLLFFGEGSFNKSREVMNEKLKMSFISFEEIPRQVFGDEENFYILLRPDNHVCFIGKDVFKCQELINKLTAL